MLSGDDELDVIKLNVGGVVFETKRSTLEGGDKWRLTDTANLGQLRPATQDYFFDRDPLIFSAVLNYRRTGKLHVPSNVCGPAINVELEFWQIEPCNIAKCCWSHYNEWHTNLKAMETFEKDRKSARLEFEENIPAGERLDTKWNTYRFKVWEFLNRSDSSHAAKCFEIISLLFAVAALFSFVAATTEPFEYYESHSDSHTSTALPTQNVSNNSSTESPDQQEDHLVQVKHPVLFVIDIICLVYFSLEYIIRLVFSPNKLKYVISLLAVIDILALIPDFIEIVALEIKPDLLDNTDAVLYLLALRVLRVLRIFRLVRHSYGLWILLYTLRASFNELLLLVWFAGLGTLFFSSLIYFVEDRDLFPSIPEGCWWAIITMTTVGYGDVSPEKPIGKIIGSMCALVGVLVIGFTVPTLVNNFILYYKQAVFVKQSEKRKHAKQKLEKSKNLNQKKNSSSIELEEINGNVR